MKKVSAGEQVRSHSAAVSGHRKSFRPKKNAQNQTNGGQRATRVVVVIAPVTYVLCF